MGYYGVVVLVSILREHEEGVPGPHLFRLLPGCFGSLDLPGAAEFNINMWAAISNRSSSARRSRQVAAAVQYSAVGYGRVSWWL